MSLLALPGGLRRVCSNYDTTRPASSLGTSVTPGQNAYGTYAQLLTGAAVTRELFGLFVQLGNVAVSGQAKDAIATIGIDPAGGTNPANAVDLIPHLLFTGAATPNGLLPVSYFFPIYIPQGASVWCKGSVNNVTVGTFRCMVTGYGDPTDPRAVRFGTHVEALGAVTASSGGTAVTAGTTNDGAWTELGTLSKDAWWFQHGVALNNNAFAGNFYSSDLSVGDGSNFEIVQDNMLILTNTAEQMTYVQPPTTVRPTSKNTKVYGRLQTSGASSESGLGLIAYALGG